MGCSVQRVVSIRKSPRIQRRMSPSKRCLDVVLVLLSLPVVVPLMLLCIAAVMVEDGRPIFFFQKRTGFGGRRFNMYKFRTMVTSAEELKEKLGHLNELTFPDFKIADDPRITRVGTFLRRTSLDELPQLINVLIGNMSLVGPRPTSFAAETYELWHTERLEVTPGITGLWQISGRSDIDFDERSRLDIEYMENQSLLYDIRILVLTVLAIFSKRGAY